MKKEIEQAILNGDDRTAEQLIQRWEEKNPMDFELYSFRIALFLARGEVQEAYRMAKQAVRVNPFHVEANYNLAVAAESMGYLTEAWSYYQKTEYLQRDREGKPVPADLLSKQCEDVYARIQEEDTMRQELDLIRCLHLYMLNDPFKSYEQDVVGTAIADCFGQEYYVGFCDGWFESYYDPTAKRDAVRMKCEVFPIDHVGRKYTVEGSSLLPVVLNYNREDPDKNCLIHPDVSWDQAYFENASCKYSFIPTTQKMNLASYKDAVWGRPILLHPKDTDSGRKKLILNLFIDSLNYSIIEKYGLSSLMPYTADFFAKGVDCKQYYACSEYTLPSIATYWTGKHPTTHMNLNNTYRHDFMGSGPVFSELFKDEGYVTAKIGGNDSVTPTQGYIRGFDRFIYQNNSEGLTVKEVVMDTLEHLRTFSDTDQFLWLDIVDLHHVAGGFMRSLEVQAQSPLKSRFIDNEIKTTIQQSHSRNREILFCNEMKKIDFYLSILYHYITDHYKDEEIIVSFFSDHGTAFLVEDQEPFLSHQRTRIPLFLRGSSVAGMGSTDEVIETTDYAGILCKLAGVPYSYRQNDANLPRCFGGVKERKYAISQSLFPGDPYRIAFHSKDQHIYLETKHAIGSQFEIDLDEFTMWAVDAKGNAIDNWKEQQQYLEITKKEIGHLIKYCE